MNKNTIIVVLILVILAGILLFAMTVVKVLSYLAIGIVIIAFVALLFVSRK